jgi:2-methylaconitate cis-trans-isomerase PrpF
MRRSFKVLSYHLRKYHTAVSTPSLFGYEPFMAVLDPSLSVQRQRSRHTFQAVLMRAGTSKGLFIHRQNLPSNEDSWATPLLAAMGSQNPDPKQIDGIGGATSTTSKVAVVSPSLTPGVDVDYTFVQVGVGSQTVDFSGNCGNMASGVGPFALQEGLVRPIPGQKTVSVLFALADFWRNWADITDMAQMKVRIFNTNTSRYIEETIEVDEQGDFQEDGDYAIPGVQGSGSEVKVAFLNPAGSMTSKLFPTGYKSEIVKVIQCKSAPGPFSVLATLIDVANPFIFVDAYSLPPFMQNSPVDSPAFLDGIESIRRTGAVLMGLANNTTSAAAVRGTPKIAVLYRQTNPTSLGEDAQIRVQSFSMGKPHPSLQLTGAACLASAVCVRGTIAHQLSLNSLSNPMLPSPERTPSPVSADAMNDSNITTLAGDSLPKDSKQVSITHGSGSISVGVLLSQGSDKIHIDKCIVSRTARRLFAGQVFCYY